MNEFSALEGLNEAQREAVTTTEGPVRVIAGAGSGKTRALSRRFAYLVNDLGIMPGNILCVTFTNKAANEMRQRIRQLTGDSDTGYVNTFHGFCVQFLREEIHVLNYPKEFMILDEDDQKSLLRKAYADLGYSLKDLKISSVLDFVGGRKANDLDYVSLFAELPKKGASRCATTRTPAHATCSRSARRSPRRIMPWILMTSSW